MPRRKIPLIPDLPYHLVNRVLDRAFYPSDMPHIWDCSLRLLSRCKKLYGSRIHGYVLMHNHYHLLASAPDGRIDALARHFQSSLSRWLAEHFGTQHFRFQTRYQATVIPDPAGYLRVLRYVARNPIKAGLSRFCEDYEFSSWARTGKEPLHHQPFEAHLFESDLNSEDVEAWINTSPSEEESEYLSRGLKHPVLGEVSLRTNRRAARTSTVS